MADTPPTTDDFSGIPLESDPAIFTDLARAIGVRGLEFRDVLSLDAADLAPGGALALPQPIHALVLVYTTTRAYEAGLRAARQAARDAGNGYAGYGDAEPAVWFAQTVRHACGLFAKLHALANLAPVGGATCIGGSPPILFGRHV
ncbi:ubiquitin carboxyl-terminal hydrolase, partial [Mycena sp. CBHHK59/15]